MSQGLARDLVAALLEMTQAQVEVELVVEAAERGHESFQRHVGIERHLREGMIARPCDGFVSRIGVVAAETLGEEIAGLEVLGLFGRTEGEEELGVHARRSGLEAKSKQERRALTEPRVHAPGATAPHEPRRLAHRRLVGRGIEAGPRDILGRVPAKALRLTVQLADGRALGLEVQREAPLHEALLLGLIASQQPVARLCHAVGTFPSPLLPR